ncbi:unnamed protein product [Pneumocystis jirovecii]|uniref:Uncharacterized protein n=1 Tax=Pneumocystis jirovecii TaxID=42068 RepID=L0PFC5_PNEJI|nr:unnamed protein product [Pneumocystis jirovecii]
MRTIKNAYTHLTSKDSYVYPESSSVLISMMSTELSAVKNSEKQSKNILQGSNENVLKNKSRSKSPMSFASHSGYSSYFGYERVIIRGDNDYYRWLQDYAKRDMFTDWVESAFGRIIVIFKF